MITRKAVLCILSIYAVVKAEINSKAHHSELYSNITIEDASGISVAVNDCGNFNKKETVLCQDGEVYKSLSACLAQCTGKLDKNSGSEVRYKMVVFNESEFYTISNGSLILKVDVPMRIFDPGYYFIVNNSAHICYPLNVKLNTCLQELFVPSSHFKITFFNDTRTINVEWHRIGNISVSNYYKTKNEDIVTCKSFPTLITLNMIGFIISGIALVLTLSIILLIPSFRKKHNEALICHMITLFLTYLFITLKYILPLNILKTMCPTLAFFQQFCYLSAFAWMNVLFYSLHRSFKSLHPVAGFDFRRFYCSCVYAGGVPLIITLITVLAQFTKVSLVHPHLEQYCWFPEHKKLSALLYVYAPMACALIINMVYFLRIIRHMQKLKKEVVSVNKSIHKQVFVLSVKLVFIMGICWFAKVIVWVADGASDVWRYIDIVNSFQGVFVFLVYIPNPKQLRRAFHTSSTRKTASSVFYFSSSSGTPNKTVTRKKLSPKFKRQTM